MHANDCEEFTIRRSLSIILCDITQFDMLPLNAVVVNTLLGFGIIFNFIVTGVLSFDTIFAMVVDWIQMTEQ
jgi:hypothetical protein